MQLMENDMNFFEQFYYGGFPSKEMLEIVNYYIDSWYNNENIPDNTSLNAYLGLTEKEYQLFTAKPADFVEYMIDVKYGKRTRI